MNEAFWYRPLWQQALPVGLFIGVSLLAGYFLLWEKNKKQLMELATDNFNLIEKITKETGQLRHSPSLQHLNQQIQALKHAIDIKEEPVELFVPLNNLLTHSDVTLNQLQPTTNQAYFMELQGAFMPIYHFIEQLLTLPQTQKWYFQDFKIQLKQDAIVASMTFSLFNTPLAITDDNHNE